MRKIAIAVLAALMMVTGRETPGFSRGEPLSHTGTSFVWSESTCLTGGCYQLEHAA